MTGTFVAAHLLRRGISLACHAHVTGQGGHVGLLGLLRPRVPGVVAAHVTTQGWFVLCVHLLGLGTGQGEGGAGQRGRGVVTFLALLRRQSAVKVKNNTCSDISLSSLPQMEQMQHFLLCSSQRLIAL